MAKLPCCSGKEVLNVLLKEGFSIKRQRGSHVILSKARDEKHLYVTIPLHANKDIPPGTLLSIIRQAGMKKEEFMELFEPAA